ncbi:NucA/NucB deoxyribonuclease domain-containing protein [Streptomyces sp. NPDC086554]|uniref:NucA/NucB deoxyribonuclease domain-containing protein n=1 Tax=Streptomyces sp. NPDC086554 TaxID=3154864 RepID=UPI003428ADE3
MVPSFHYDRADNGVKGVANHIYDSLHKLAEKHKAERTKACNRLARPGPTYQCDEFPFVSAMEGAGVGDGNFSVRYVPATENEKAGRGLAGWYGSDRILHGHQYGIYVD